MGLRKGRLPQVFLFLTLPNFANSTRIPRDLRIEPSAETAASCPVVDP